MYFKLGFIPIDTVCDGADITVGFSTVIDDDWYWIDISLCLEALTFMPLR
jgi:hypothetical protein